MEDSVVVVSSSSAENAYSHSDGTNSSPEESINDLQHSTLCTDSPVIVSNSSPHSSLISKNMPLNSPHSALKLLAASCSFEVTSPHALTLSVPSDSSSHGKNDGDRCAMLQPLQEKLSESGQNTKAVGMTIDPDDTFTFPNPNEHVPPLDSDWLAAMSPRSRARFNRPRATTISYSLFAPMEPEFAEAEKSRLGQLVWLASEADDEAIAADLLSQLSCHVRLTCAFT